MQGGFMVFFLIFLITLCVGIVIAYFVAAISPDMEVANAALPAYVVTLLFFTGESSRDPIPYTINPKPQTMLTFTCESGPVACRSIDLSGVNRSELVSKTRESLTIKSAEDARPEP